MLISDLEKNLFDKISQMEVIDCHEHLPFEEERVNTPVDFFTLFTHYTRFDLQRAGMSEDEYKNLFNHDIPLETRFGKFEPYWKKIRYTSFAKAVLLAVEKFYGFSDINEDTYKGISEAIKKANKPGIYEIVLRKACKIKACLNLIYSTYVNRTDLKTEFFIPIIPIFEFVLWEQLSHPLFEPDANIRILNDYLEAIGRYILRLKSMGAIGIKTQSSPACGEPNREEAISLFEKIKSGKVTLPTPQWPEFAVDPLQHYVRDWAIKFAGEQNLVIAVHTGYWGDFRHLDPLNIIPFLKRHPKVRFDIYHLGYPWTRETLMLAKNFSNVWLNFCWTHIISQRSAISTLDEALDLIPINKILAFGGDYGLPVEKVYGHLVMARENIAKVLAKRIQEGEMDEKEALDIANKWFWENPKELYNLNL